jgi:N-glycosylase/DNA lyase
MNKTIEFAIYLTGKDRKTVLEMYKDYLEKSPVNLRKVKRSPLTSTNLLAKAINSQKPL